MIINSWKRIESNINDIFPLNNIPYFDIYFWIIIEFELLILAYFLSIYIIWWCHKKNNNGKSLILRKTCTEWNHQMQYDQRTSWKSFLNAAELKLVSHNFYLYAYRVLQITALSFQLSFPNKVTNMSSGF